jgi:hypothetical protein
VLSCLTRRRTKSEKVDLFDFSRELGWGLAVLAIVNPGPMQRFAFPVATASHLPTYNSTAGNCKGAKAFS